MTYLKEPPIIARDRLVWQATGPEPNDPSIEPLVDVYGFEHRADERSRMVAHIRIGWCDMHLEAWEVVETENFKNQPVDTRLNDDLDALEGMMDCAFDTLEIDGRNYVLIATPYGR